MGLLGMDDETLALVGGLLSRGAIGRGINSYLDQKTRAQQLALVEDYKRQKMEEEQRKAAEVAAKQQAMQAATQPPQWAQDAGPLGAYAKAPSDADAAMGMARVANEPKTMHDLLKLQQDSRETFSDPRVAMQNGNPVFMQSGKYGGSRVVPGMEPPPDLQMLDLKDRIIAADKLRTAPGTVFQAGQSPDNKATTGLGYSRLAWEKAKDAAERGQGGGAAKPSIVDGQFVFPPDAQNPQGRAIPIPGFTGKADPKAAQSAQVPGLVKEANELLDKATGSYVGTGRDIAAGAVGMATEGAKATAQLRVLAAKLMFAQPRFEGPQGVLDVKLYEQAAGDLANSTKPVEVRKAALQTILKMHEAYGKPQQIQEKPSGGWSITEVK